MIRVLLAVLIAANYLIGAGFNGKIEFVSDYLFRGVTQTDHENALQGTLRYSFESGFYLGAFGSNIYDPRKDNTRAIEYDFRGGYLGEAGDMRFEAGAISRNFSFEDANFVEALFAVGYGGFDLAYYSVISADGGRGEGDRYVEASAGFSEVLDLVDIGFGAGYALPNDRDEDKPLNLFASLGRAFGRSVYIGARGELYSSDAKSFGKPRGLISLRAAF
ncbi:MAG: TorF family putative porin [Helicobacteraceae bacterium]|jgi:uncharacterized protein (TIGR02001 family)|nr:TorF family putative porin [Helicobacteraceae bacterium]